MIFSRPTKHDLKQFSFLISKGVTLPYIREIMDVSEQEFNKKWYGKVESILNSIPEVNPAKFTMHHVDVRDSIEFAFECGLIKYYRFKSELRLPTGRYKYHYKYLQLNAMRIDPEILKAEIKESRSWLNGERKKIDIEKTLIALSKIEARASLPFDPELARKLAAVSFFTEDEDLSTYDEDLGNKKIAHWKEHKFNDFFLTMPVEELLNLKGISIISLEEYLETAHQIMKDLTPDTPTS